ncbi:MAG: sensor histidine kinase [Gammaproteobacteria bacterium]
MRRRRGARPWSLHWRLVAATSVAASVAVLLAGWVLAGLFRDHVTRQFVDTLTTQLDQVTARLERGAEARPTLDTSALSDPRWSRPYSGLYWQVDVAAAGGVQRGVLRSRSLWDAQLEAPRDAVADGEVHVHEVAGPGGATLQLVERTVRVDATGTADPGHWRVLVAADRAPVDAAAARFNAVLAASLAVLLVLLVAAAAAQVGVGLAPLRGLQRALGAVHAGRAQRLEGRFPSEVQPLVEDFNAVLGRNAEVVARARTQAGNLAHALKTPLAVLAQAAQAARERPESLPALPRLVDEQVLVARRQVDWQLARARAAAAQGVPGVQAAVAPLVDGLVRAMSRVHAHRELRFDTRDVDRAVVFAGEAQDLQEMLGNVLDNACKWARGAVRVSARRCGDDARPMLCVTVEDDGPGIDTARRERALARGERLDESVPGSGLGLAIVQELAALYGGALTLGDASLGGLQVALTLPAVAGEPSR